MTLNVEIFTLALRTLPVALQEYRDHPSLLSSRDGCIQRFEYCFSLAIAFIYKVLKEKIGKAEIEALKFSDVMREAARSGLVLDPDAWVVFQQKRNKTAHAYNQDVANEVFSVLEDFYQQADYLLEQIKKRGGHG